MTDTDSANPQTRQDLRQRAEAQLTNEDFTPENYSPVEARLRLATTAAQLGVFEWDFVSDQAFWENDRMYEIFGCRPEEGPITLDTFFSEFLDPESRPAVTRTLAQFIQKKQPFQYVCRIRRRPDGERRWLEISGRFYQPPGATALRLVGVVADITARKLREDLNNQTEEALRESEQQYRLLLNTIPAVVFRGYADYSVDFFDDKIEELTGYSKEIFSSRQMIWREVILPEDLDSAALTFRQALKNSGAYVREYRLRHRDGRILCLQERGQIILDPQGRIDYISGIFFDITPQKEMAQALAAEKERLRVTLRSISEGVIATDIFGRVVLMNRVAEKLSGWPQALALGQPAATILNLHSKSDPPELTEPVAQVIHTGQPFRLINETTLLSRTGYEHLLTLNAAPIVDQTGQILGVVLIFRDITLERQTEKELLKKDKLSSLGILAGGIAHDFNNILAGILGNISLGGLCLDERDRIQECLEGAEKATLRAQSLVQQLLTFAKGGTPIKELAQLLEIIRNSANFACRSSSSQPIYTLPQDLWPVEIDPGQISQVFQNLVINALQAMPAGGPLEIRAENLMVGTHDGLPLTPGKYIKISFTDRGVGIPPENLARIFDPYFTTKPKGSGLGLAVVYSIVQHHHGHITVDSKPSVGSTFSVFLPAVEPLLLAAETRIASFSAYPIQELTRSRGRILVMDDEDMILELTGKLLAQLGYDAAAARNGAEALELYSQALASGQPFDAVILDLTVRGGMGGRETMAKLLDLDPQVRGIVASGYSEDQVMTQFREFGFKAVMRKPFAADKFAHILHDVLHGPNST